MVGRKYSKEEETLNKLKRYAEQVLKFGYSLSFNKEFQCHYKAFDPIKAFSYLLCVSMLKSGGLLNYCDRDLNHNVYNTIYLEMTHVFRASFVDVSVKIENEKELRLLYHLVCKDSKYGLHIYSMLKRGEVVNDGYRDRIEESGIWNIDKLQKVFKLKDNVYSKHIREFQEELKNEQTKA